MIKTSLSPLLEIQLNIPFSSKGSAHTARTMMLHELELLFTAVPEETATKKDYFDAIVQNNCLGKRSMVNRHLTFRHMATLYSLDGNSPLFQALRYLWHRDATAHPLLAALCSYARDSLFRLTFPFLLSLHEEQA